MTDPSEALGRPLNVSGPQQPAHPGYDHPWYAWPPAGRTPPARWPSGARTALSVVLRLGAAEWEPDEPPRPQATGGRGVAPPPDIPRMSHREFGHRVGIFRLLDILAEFAVPASVVIDVATAECYPALLARLTALDVELLAGGLSAGRPITSAMSEAEERDYVAETLDRLAAQLGARPRGWLSPEHSESARTPRLLAEAGVEYLMDWGNDEVPYPMVGDACGLWAFPLSWELSDVAAMFARSVPADVWARSVCEAFDELHAEGGRVLGLHLEPWLSGQAFRSGAVESVLFHLRAATDVWFASPGEIVAHSRGSR